MTTSTGDKYGDKDFETIPTGPHKGQLWTYLKPVTLQNILNAVAQGTVVLDERRVAAIRSALAGHKATGKKAEVSGQ